ncbi:protein MIZU-KUSSEI 1-like protein [Cinnamomum micranthum f. kanehirae]|uniref:Protein MIZU-KUSSEI 1-like protein n=1 Tax=Cinnamomum micranthum f. kanehirae TaxID=337451 RepID=A0A443NIT3_9MAGN|nr:protein MIZU-KUSSEI 1-like protein [Cinnamomum micranthum f. kanehirae]
MMVEPSRSRREEPGPTSASYTKPQVSLLQPSQKKKKTRPFKLFQLFRSLFRSFPIVTPSCTLPAIPESKRPRGAKVTGTLFGYRNGRVSLSIQENSRCLPSIVLELAMQTSFLQKEMSLGMVRIALECDKRLGEKERMELLEEPLWTLYCNGKKSGFGVKREATEDDLKVMELLMPVSMGAGVLPGNSDVEGSDGELAYMRAHFEQVVGSRDSETLYMLGPDGNSGPELTIFFVRI